jgi:hypothetical protein
MPEIETQTEKFVILSKEQVKALSISERREYKAQYKIFKREEKKRKYNDYMRTYMKNYKKMKYKYDPAFREKCKLQTRNKYYINKQHKHNNDVIQHTQPIQTTQTTQPTNILGDLFFIL